MADQPQNRPENRKANTRLKLFWVVFSLGLTLAWLIATPPGLLGKSDAAAYAVCHRISSHSFYFGERPLSLCARCTGQYLGFLWGFGLQAILGKKRSGFPSRWAVVGLGLLVLFYALDGLNSLFTLYPTLETWALYTPQNTLRLFSGLGMGLAISALYYPLMGQTIWSDLSPRRSLERKEEWLLFFSGGLGIGLLVLSDNPLLLYPLILFSTGGLMTLLTLLYTVIWILLSRRENSFRGWGDLGWWMLAGFGTALFQIAMIDAVRFWITGTWSGFLEY